MASTDTATRVLSNYVGGRWTESESSELLDVTNPATGDVLARVPLSTAGELDAAVAAARAALPAWRAVAVPERARRLFTLREKLVARKDEFARCVTTEMGKTLPDARAEVGRMIEMVEAACAVPTTMQGRIIEDVARNVDAETVRQPVGVCAAIVPFNFPAMVPFWFLPFAIACGNTFVLKPSEQVPMTQSLVFESLDELDLPAGVVNLVNGDRQVADAILDHPGIDAVSFVGSAKVARHVYARAAARGKRVQALGGAKNHMVVMPDAVLDKTVSGILGSAFGAAGQRCMAGSVVVAVGDAHARLREALREAAAGMRVGDGLEEGVDVGPLISPAACERVRGYVDRAAAEGADIVLDGRERAGRVRRPDDRRRRDARDGDLARRGVRPRARDGPRRVARRRDRDRQRERLRQRRLDLHRVGRRGPPLPPRRRGRDDRRQRRRRGAGRVLPVLGLEGLLPRRPARPRPRRGRVLHAQEDRHEPLVLGWRDGAVFRRVLSMNARRIWAVMSESFWVLLVAIVALFVFLLALGAYSPGEVVDAHDRDGRAVRAWVGHAAWVSRRADKRDPRAIAARERRGF